MTAAISAGSRPLSRACWRMMSSWRSGSVISRTAWWKQGDAQRDGERRDDRGAEHGGDPPAAHGAPARGRRRGRPAGERGLGGAGAHRAFSCSRTTGQLGSSSRTRPAVCDHVRRPGRLLVLGQLPRGALVDRLVPARGRALTRARPRRRRPRSSRRRRRSMPASNSSGVSTTAARGGGSARATSLAPRGDALARRAATAAPRATRVLARSANARARDRRAVDRCRRVRRPRPSARRPRRAPRRSRRARGRPRRSTASPRRAARAPRAPSTCPRRAPRSARRTGSRGVGCGQACSASPGSAALGLAPAAAPRRLGLGGGLLARGFGGRPRSPRPRQAPRPTAGSAVVDLGRRRLRGASASARPRAASAAARRPPRRPRLRARPRRPRGGRRLGSRRDVAAGRRRRPRSARGRARRPGRRSPARRPTPACADRIWPSTRLTDSDRRRRSESISRIFTLTSSPGCTTSRGFSTWCGPARRCARGPRRRPGSRRTRRT